MKIRLHTQSKNRTWILVLIVIASLALVGFFIAGIMREDPPIVEDTGKFVITLKGQRTEEVTLEIKGELPAGYFLRVDDSKTDGKFICEEIASSADSKTFRITPLSDGVGLLDFYYENGAGELWQKLHYTIDIIDGGKVRMYDVNAVE